MKYKTTVYGSHTMHTILFYHEDFCHWCANINNRPNVNVIHLKGIQSSNETKRCIRCYSLN